MRLTETTPFAHSYLVFQIGAEPCDEDPLSEYRMTLIGRLKAVDDDEGWVDQYQEDGSIKRIYGDFMITTAAEMTR